jgi:hypothetical protein
MRDAVPNADGSKHESGKQKVQRGAIVGQSRRCAEPNRGAAPVAR